MTLLENVDTHREYLSLECSLGKFTDLIKNLHKHEFLIHYKNRKIIPFPQSQWYSVSEIFIKYTYPM